MKFIKILSSLLVLILLLTGVYGCSRKEMLTVNEISNALEEICFNSEEIYEISKADIENRFNFDGNLLRECSIKLCQTEEKFLMVAVLQPKEEAHRQTIIEGMNNNVKSASQSFGVLGGEMLAKIQQRLLYEYEDILIVVIAENYDAVKSYLKEIGAKAIM